MAIFYGKNSNNVYGFYDTDIHDNIPSSSVEITKTEHVSLMLAQSKGAAIITSEYGSPQAISENGGGSLIDLSTVTKESDFNPPLTLKDMATIAFMNAKSIVYDNYGIINEPTPDVWVKYIKELLSIMKGNNPKVTSLPLPPEIV